MATGSEQRKADLIESVATRVRGHLDPSRAEGPSRFVRQLYAGVAPSDLVDDTADNLYGSALALWNFARERTPGAAKVRVYNPTLENHGWRSPHTVIEVVTDDMPFLVDSVTGLLQRMEITLNLLIPLVVGVERGADGLLVLTHEQRNGNADRPLESFMQVRVTQQPEEEHEGLAHGIQQVLTDVRAAVEDWGAMRRRCAEALDSLDAESEPAQLLTWLLDDHFAFLGCREYVYDVDHARVVAGSGLGVLRDGLAAAFQGMITGGRRPVEADEPGLVRVVKGNRRSTVHRPVLMDTLGIKMRNADGVTVGEVLFIGLFTSTAYAESPFHIPVLREKVRGVLERAEYDPSGHAYKSLVHILETYPRDELWQIDVEQLHQIALGLLRLQAHQRIALFTRVDRYERYVSCLVFAPRDLYDTKLRLRFQEILETALAGHVITYATKVEDSPLARLLFTVRTTPGEIPPFDNESLERRLSEAGRSWAERLHDALVEAHGEQRGIRVLRRFEHAFPASYVDAYPETVAVRDIGLVEEAIRSGDLAMSLYRPVAAAPHDVNLKIYSCGEPLPLSRTVPMLENLGLEVLGESPFLLRPAGVEQPVWIRDVYMRTQDRSPIDLASVRELFHEALTAVWCGELENDGFNRLVLSARLTARQVMLVRSYSKFLRQARTPFSQTYMVQTLAKTPGVARTLVELFEARFAPTGPVDRDAVAEGLRTRIERALESVSSLDEDRILRRFVGAVEATLRTNYYQRIEGKPKSYLSLKFDSRALPWLPKPRPLREIFVYSPRMEGIHLRGGLVARGGIRWSDRREDFRTEVLGLMKAQMVKNAVIVPVGSKGGFVVKQLPTDAKLVRGEVLECYRTLIRGLLDLTDNLDGDRVLPPTDVVRRDGDDPYLVVAADKGTATFSDTANEVAAAYGLWLDDAFASGGSAGYDHKKIGITARGAWESVKRHFREMGKDIQSEDFTCVGVGDMSGDVFGNGMLLSRHMHLVAAFNHQHVFVDPSPDLEASFRERERLFAEPSSSWADYDQAVISEGGGVFERSAKAIPVSPQMKSLLGIEDDHVPPNDLIRSLLTLPVELLWLGGIGTYVRATTESDGDVGDRANDAVRVTGRELGAQVVGEGANLGLTQRARIEYALRGGRINTDAIDNSAGVDCSDHEVNLKILLGAVERAGDMTRKQRNELLVAMTDEVADLVLRDNYLQTQTITVTEQLGGHLLDRLGRFMRALEREGRLDRSIEFLPDDEALAERLQSGRGLTRPEIAVLVSYAKIVLYDEVLASSLPDGECPEEDLLGYFPGPVRERFRDAILSHRLKREIVATVVTNDIVNRMGVAFVRETRDKTGMPVEEIVRAYLVGRRVFALPKLWRAIEALDNAVPADTQALLLTECGRFLERQTVWLLREASSPIHVRGETAAFSEGSRELESILASVLTTAQQTAFERRIVDFVERGAPPDVAAAVARLTLLESAYDIIRLATDSQVTIERAATTYFLIGERFGYTWLRATAGELPSDTAWDKLAVTALLDDLFGHQADLTACVLRSSPPEIEPRAALEAWAATRAPLVARTDQLLSELQSMGSVNLAMLAVANRQFKSMAG